MFLLKNQAEMSFFGTTVALLRGMLGYLVPDESPTPNLSEPVEVVNFYAFIFKGFCWPEPLIFNRQAKHTQST